MTISVQPEWCRSLPLQQQSVLLLAARGPDGFQKHHPCKRVHVAYRGCVLMAAKYGRMLEWGEKADTFMSLDVFADTVEWKRAISDFFEFNGSLPHHYLLHFYHGAEILGYKHPESRYREKWNQFYEMACEAMHVKIETEFDMDLRLGDWNRDYWEEERLR